MITVAILAVAVLVLAIILGVIYFTARGSKSDETGRGGPIQGQGPETPKRTEGREV